MKIRKAKFAGTWYPGKPDVLYSTIEEMGKNFFVETQREVLGLMSPHAGYIYSGGVAAVGYKSIKVPDTVVILCPKHTWLGSNRAIMSSGGWEIPGAVIPINETLGSSIKEKARLEEDMMAHQQEHSLELQLPFLYWRNNNFSFVPIALGSLSFVDIEEIGKGIAEAIKEYGKKTLIVASSDMSHYVPQEVAQRLDKMAIQKIIALDPEGLWEVVHENDISMCGVVPVTAMLVAVKHLGATSGELLRYATSGDVSGDYSAVVGYASVILY